MIRLLAYPLPPSFTCKLALFLSIPVCHRASLLTRERVGRGLARSQSRRESVVLYKSFNTLRCQHREELPWKQISTSRAQQQFPAFFRCPPLELSTCCLPSFFVISRHVYLSIYPSSILSVCTVYKQNKKAEHVSILQDCVMRNLCFLIFDFDQFIRKS